MIIGLTGTNASGKTTVVEHLISKGFQYFSLSDVIREELNKRHLDHSRDNLRSVGNELRQRYGANVLAERIRFQISSQYAVIDSVRNVEEVASLRQLPKFILIAVDAPLQARFKRSMNRGRLENAVDIQTFKKLENMEKSDDQFAQHIDQCIKLADYFIYNDKGIDELHNRIDQILMENQGL